MIIDKIVLSGFSDVQTETVVELDKYTNLIANRGNLKRSIPLAIDFLLNRAYEDSDLALNCRFRNIPEQNDKSFVTLHISSATEFEFDRECGKELIVSRRASKNRIDLVEYKFGTGKEKIKSRMTIADFHIQLNRLNLLRIHEPIISERSRPTSLDMNKMFVDALNIAAPLRQMNLKEFFGKSGQTARDAALDIMRMEMKKMADAKDYLIKYRTIEAALVMNGLNGIFWKFMNADFGARAKQRELSLYMEVEKYETIQTQRFLSQKEGLQKAYDWVSSVRCVPINLTEFNGHFNTFLGNLETFMKEKEIAREIEAEVMEYNASRATKSTLQHYFNQPKPIEEFIKMCDKYADAYRRGFEGIYRHNAWEIVQKSLQMLPMDLESRRVTVNNTAKELECIEQRCLHAKAAKFEKMHEFIQCTNQIALAQVNIDEFFQRQKILNPSHVEAWRRGFLVLTLPPAYEKEIHKDFVGNVLDFVNPNLSDVTLMSYLPLLISHPSINFTTFIFKTKESGDAFLEMAQPFLKPGLQLLYTVVDVEEEQRMEDLPFKSLADFLLTKDTCARYPFVKNLFDQFQVIDGACKKTPSQLFMIAREYNCTIIHGNKSLSPSGQYTEIYNGKGAEQFQELLTKWQHVAKYRDSKINALDKKFALDLELLELNQIQKDNDKQIFAAKRTIMNELRQISDDMTELFMLVNTHDEMEKKAIENYVKFKDYQKKKELLEAGNPHPEMGELKCQQNIPSVNAAQAQQALQEFSSYSLDISRNIATKVLPLRPDAAEKFKHEIADRQKGLNELQSFNYKQQLNVMAVESKEQLDKLCADIDKEVDTQNDLFKLHMILSNKYKTIEANPWLVNLEEAHKLSDKSPRQLQDMKHAIRLSDDLILPDPEVNLESFKETYDNFERAIIDGAATKVDVAEISQEVLWIEAYFKCLQTMLKHLNCMTPHGNETIGFEVDCDNNKLHIFPDTELDHIIHGGITLKSLCGIGTGLTFVSKNNLNMQVIATSDLLDIKSHRFGLLFHLLLSVAMNQSFVVLNNSIIGHPVDQLKNLLRRFQLWPKFNSLTGELEYSSRQLIVVSRDPTAYDNLFEIEGKKF